MKYCDRSIHSLALYFGLCLSEKGFKKELYRLKLKQPVDFLRNARADATVHFLHTDKTNVAIVCLRPAKEHSLEIIYGLLVHESVHIWQEHLKLIGEKNPSPEFDAYAIQNISQKLMLSYKEQTKRKQTWKTRGARLVTCR
jgi:hypothetical protein